MAIYRSAKEASSRPPVAFASLYASNAEAILAFFARRTFEVEVARDLTAETFALALEGLQSFRGSTEEEAAGWVFGIARHQLSRYMRQGVAEQAAVGRLGIQVPAISPDDSERIVELAGLEELRSQVAGAFSDLKEEHQEALRLRVIDERPYPEVASELGVSEQTARARVSRGLRRLADAVEVTTNTEAMT